MRGPRPADTIEPTAEAAWLRQFGFCFYEAARESDTGSQVVIDRLNDTIVAISSAPGHSAVGLVRLSGPDALAIASQMAELPAGQSLALGRAAARFAGEILIGETLSVPAALYLFFAPRSYTRQDVVEIHTAGSPSVLELVRRRAISFGAVPAEPGEFTARAFLNGAMDLAKAEAVAAVIRAQTDAQLRASRRMMDGALARRIKAIRDELAELLGLVEADIDFAEEPIEFITPVLLRERLNTVVGKLSALSSSAALIERFDVLPHVLLFGPPNAGKSSLMNRLSGTSRAICAAAAGTTRDVLSAPIRVGRGEAILLDAAGVDRSEDEIISQARAMVMTSAEQVDLLCLVVDVSDPVHEHVLDMVRSLDAPSVLIAANKSDLVSDEQAQQACQRLESQALGPVFLTSALTAEGVERLRAGLGDELGSTRSTTMGESVLISARQLRVIQDAGASIEKAKRLAADANETIDKAEMLAFELREAVDALGVVTGEVTTEDLLEQVFANFCIGK